ncbi:uncharacterized protein LOC113517971 [Galleria mellonella]|uniref:Odorant receptor n=1 Tax=Galleria mellonella TaxID=7137 RepID=A0A5C0E3Z5_GALME|nr:uncharacterized protein LOC113517971 [Galleria mellonella]QEI46822.1 odorant receptor 6 [Galleria mellonella]
MESTDVTLRKSTKYVSRKITKFFISINKILVLYGLPIIWTHDFTLSKNSDRVSGLYRILSNILIIVFVAMEWGAFYTQNNLTEKQSSDRLMFCVTHPILVVYILNIEYYEKKIKVIMYKMMVTLKQSHNDVEVEKKLFKKCMFYSVTFFTSVALSVFFYGFDAYIQAHSGSTFTKTISAWPDVEDRSLAADVVRVVNYVILVILLTRVSGVYVLVVLLTICISHQYTNINTYFLSLSKIFNENLTQIEKEKKYERALIIGIDLHSQTMWCKRQCQSMFNVVFSFQIILNVMLLVLLMLQMTSSERTLMNAIPVVSTGVSLLCSTGFFMWNAGDITVEASSVATALYCSGWENCHVSTLRIRYLLLMTIRQGQKPEMLKALGLIPLSYDTYVSIVKASYSIFSVIY